MSGATDLRTADDAVSWAVANLSPAIDNLSPAEKSAVKQYTSGGYQQLNDYPRATDEDTREDLLEFANLDVLGTQRDLDSAIAKSLLPTDIGVVRATNTVQFDTPVEHLIGSVQTDAGYLSTSVGRTPVLEGGVRLHLRVPAGSPGLYIDSISRNQGERELLLPRDTRYRVENVEIDEFGKYIVTGVVER